MKAPSQKGDQFVVRAPPGDSKLAVNAASEIRAKDFFGYYEDKLSITALGFAGQPKPYNIYLDPGLPAALKNADGLNDHQCENPAINVVDVYSGISDAEFHATLAHELFHAAQAALAGPDHRRHHRVRVP